MAHSGDRSLLDRLNALKPTSVNLDRSTNALSIPATGIQPAEPLSREDALTERLRSLRNRRDRPDSSASGDPPPPYTASSATGAQPQPALTSARATGPASDGDEARRHRSGGDGEVGEGCSQSSGEYDDHYFDDVLQPLDLEDEDSSPDEDEGAAGGDSGSSKRVEDLLAKLKADPGAQPPVPAESKPDVSSMAKDEGSDEDDSEGETMSREVENVISRAMDELRLDGPASQQPTGPDAAPRARGDPEVGGDPELALPTVPQDAAGDKEGHSTSPKPTTKPGGSDKDGDGEGLSLPAVPTELVDPAPTSGKVPSGGGDDEDPFESSIVARLAALKGASAPIIRTDALGLPSAPTFRPEDNAAPGAKRLVARASGYTDADQKTWCIVCLEDGTIRCLGCDDDGAGGGEVYCARCWKEIHVGPSAGYDERGHAWEKFDPRRV